MNEDEPRTAVVVGIVVLEALGWSALSMLLAAHGHAPSGPSPLEPADHYAAQAWFAPFIVLVSFAIQTLVVRKLVRSDWKPAATIASIGGSIPITVFWVCGDLVAFTLGGFAAMRTATKFIVPLALLAQLGLVTVLTRRRGTTTKRALGVAVAALVIRGLVFAPFMR